METAPAQETALPVANPWAPSVICTHCAVVSGPAGGDLRLPGSLGGEGGAAADLARPTGWAGGPLCFRVLLGPLPWFQNVYRLQSPAFLYKGGISLGPPAPTEEKWHLGYASWKTPIISVYSSCYV